MTGGRHNTVYGRDSSSTRMYTSYGAGRAEDLFKYKKHRPEKSGDDGKISSKGKKKLGEVRREAGERRRFVERKRGLLMGLMITVMFVVIMLLIYKVLFVVRNVTVVGAEKYTPEQIELAAGVERGDNLYSFRGSKVSENVTLACPYIKSVAVDREIPSDVTYTVTEDEAAYYAVIFGEYKILSRELRVLETAESAEKIPEGLIKLKLPAVAYSVTGRGIRLADERRDYGMREVLRAVEECGLMPRLTTVDLRDQFDVSIVVESHIKLIVGDTANISRKLKVAEKVLEDEMFATENKIRVDLTIDGKTGVMIDNMMELD